MDVKYKIIFFIFIIIAILYAVHFLSSWMSTVKRREYFAEEDDESDYQGKKPSYHQENYVVSEEKHESKDLKFRVKILEIIEEMKIKDKTIKGNLVDYLFSDPIIKTINSKSDQDVRSFIKTTYDNMNVSSEEKKGITPVLPIKSNQQVFHSQEDFNQKLDDLMSHVNDLKTKISQLKPGVIPESISKGISTASESISKDFWPVTAELPYPKPEQTLTESQAKKVIETYEGIEGFENRRQYAFL